MKSYGIASGIGVFALLLAACGGGSGDEPTATANLGTSGTLSSAAAADDGLRCATTPGEGDEVGAAKLFFEYQSTDDDTGIHGLFDTSGFSELCVFAPNGDLILAVKPQSQLVDLGMGGIFFESREPVEAEFPQSELVSQFPEGSYQVAATTFDGKPLTGGATLSHAIPAPPVIVSTDDGDVVDPENLVIVWEPVTETVSGGSVDIVGYEVIVTNDEVEDPNGLAQPVLSAHVVPSVTSLTVPSEFLEPGTEYELEVIAIEKSGNQTITVVFFETP